MSCTLIIFTPLHYPHLFFLPLLLVFLSTKSPFYFQMCVCMCVSVTYVCVKSRFLIGEKTRYLSFWQISLNRIVSILNHIPASDMISFFMAEYNSTVYIHYFLYPFTCSYMLQLSPYCDCVIRVAIKRAVQSSLNMLSLVPSSIFSGIVWLGPMAVLSLFYLPTWKMAFRCYTFNFLIQMMHVTPCCEEVNIVSQITGSRGLTSWSSFMALYWSIYMFMPNKHCFWMALTWNQPGLT